MSVVAHFEPLQQPGEDRRGAPRLLLSLGASLGPSGSSVTISDISTTGLLFQATADLAVGETIEVQLPEMGATPALVIWRNGSSFGCKFEKPIPRAAVSAALLRSEPATGRGDRESVSAATDRLTSAATGQSISRRNFSAIGRGSAWLTAPIALAGAAYLLVTVEAPTLAWVAAASILLLALLVAWGVWVMDNTLDL